MNVLVIEDDQEAAAYLRKGLEESGCVVDCAADGEDGLHLALTGDHDVLVVDRMLPRRDGLSVIAELRTQGYQTPALILSALGEVDDRVQLVTCRDRPVAIAGVIGSAESGVTAITNKIWLESALFLLSSRSNCQRTLRETSD